MSSSLVNLGRRTARKSDGSGVSFEVWRSGSDDSRPNVLVLACHGTGYCGRTWHTVARRFSAMMAGAAEQQENVYFASMDLQNHGRSDTVVDAGRYWEGDVEDQEKYRELALNAWGNHESDILTVLAELVDVDAGPTDQANGTWSRVVGLGHSMGASALLLACSTRPGAIEELMLFEPIVLCMDLKLPSWERQVSSQAWIRKSLRRRSVFPNDREEVYDMLDKHAGWKAWDREVLRDWVDGALVETDDGKSLRLACDPRVECLYYASPNNVWSEGRLQRLTGLRRVWLMHSKKFNLTPFYPMIALHLPRSTRIVCGGNRTHYWPLTHPDEVATSLHSFLTKPVGRPGGVLRMDDAGELREDAKL